jgi:DNA-binding NarL/FixJ family response regulator
MIRVFVLAPTPMMQAGLHALLTAPDIQVVGLSSTPNDLTELAADVIVIADELQLDEVVGALTNPSALALIVLSENSERVLSLLRTLELRGWGILPQDVSAMQLQAAVAAVAQNLITIPPQLAGGLYEARPARVRALNLEEPDEQLTPREREVLELVSQGLSNKLIARKLQISEHTVKFHMSSIATKLGASSRTDAVRRGLRHGLITL